MSLDAIENSEFTMYVGVDTSQTDTAGGRMNHLTVIPSNAIEAALPVISANDRVNGVTQRAKLFYAIENIGHKTLLSTAQFLAYPYPVSGVVCSLIKGNFANVWGDVKNGRKYGCGVLASVPSYNATTDETTIVISTQGEAYAHFAYNVSGVGNRIAITNMQTSSDSTGKLEFHTITAASYSGSQCTVKFDGQLRHTYATSRVVNGVDVATRVASCVEHGDVTSTFSVANNTSINGTVDATKLQPRNVGCISQTITITFESSTSFQSVSNIAGVTLTGGSKNTTWSPTDTDGQAYLAVLSAFWTNNGSGDWQAGDSIQIHTEPAAMPVFLVVEVAAGTDSFSPTSINLWSDGLSGVN